jgi:predicted nucleic acid-binding protein
MTMMYIVDTNVLLRFAERRHPLHIECLITAQ